MSVLAALSYYKFTIYKMDKLDEHFAGFYIAAKKSIAWVPSSDERRWNPNDHRSVCFAHDFVVESL